MTRVQGPALGDREPGRRLYRCYLGHVQTARSLLRSQRLEVERALWSAVRALQERSTTLHRLAEDARARAGHLAAEPYEKLSRQMHDEAQRARKFLLDLQRNV